MHIGLNRVYITHLTEVIVSQNRCSQTIALECVNNNLGYVFLFMEARECVNSMFIASLVAEQMLISCL